MNMKGPGKKLFYLCFLTTCLWLPLGSAKAQATETESAPKIQSTQRSQYGTYERALVREVREQSVKTGQGAQSRLTYKLEILSGRQKGVWLSAAADAASLPAGLKPQTGETVIVFVQPGPNPNEPAVFFESRDRRNVYLWTIFILAACSLLLAGWKGLKLILAGLLAWLAIFHLALPLFLAQRSAALVIAAFLGCWTAVSSWFLLGWNKKALIAFIGSLAGGLLSCGLIGLFASWAHLEAALAATVFFNTHPLLDPRFLMLLGGMMVLTGFITDLAASIATAVTDVKQFSAGLNFKELFRAGMIVGRDRLSFMFPLLCLAYLGTAALFLAQSLSAADPWLKFINSDGAAPIVIWPLAGAIALMASVPLCSAVAALAWTRRIKVMDPLRRAISWRRDEKSPPPDEQISLPLP